MTTIFFICGLFSAILAVIAVLFECHKVLFKKETPILPLFMAFVMLIVSCGLFSEYTKNKSAVRATKFEDNKIVCENFVRHGKKKMNISPKDSFFKESMITVPIHNKKSEYVEFICYVDGNGYARHAIINAKLKNAFRSDEIPGESRGSESEKFRVEIRTKKNRKCIIRVTAKKKGTETLEISSPDCRDTKKIILKTLEEN